MGEGYISLKEQEHYSFFMIYVEFCYTAESKSEVDLER